jgi:TRAP-type C4-dicarboxylate transport system permease small subunit
MNRVERYACFLAGLTLAAFTAIVLTEVVFRYWLRIPLSWPNELSILLFQWMVFLGTPVALRRGLHFTIDIVVLVLPESVQRVLRGFSLLVAIGVGVMLIVLSYRMALSTWNTTYTALPIPAALPYIGLLICGALIVVFSLPLLLQGRPDVAVER